MLNYDTGNPWIVRTRPGLSAKIRLFCIPFAGGNASVFQNWANALPREIDVCSIELPGRRKRMTEPPFTRMALMIKAMAEDIQDYLDLPFAVFGNCTGSLAAFELSVRLQKRYSKKPVHLFVSNCRAPRLPDRDAPIHGLPNEELLSNLTELGGTPAEVLAHPEIAQLILPCLRADFEMAETYRYRQSDLLDVPITSFGGLYDKIVDQYEVEAWNQHTAADCETKMLPGGHYLIETCMSEIHETIVEKLLDKRKTGKENNV